MASGDILESALLGRELLVTTGERGLVGAAFHPLSDPFGKQFDEQRLGLGERRRPRLVGGEADGSTELAVDLDRRPDVRAEGERLDRLVRDRPGRRDRRHGEHLAVFDGDRLLAVRGVERALFARLEQRVVANGADDSLCVGGDPGEKAVVETEVVPAHLEEVGDLLLAEALLGKDAVERIA